TPASTRMFWSLGWGIARKRLTRTAVINLVLRVGGFIALSFIFSLPYTTWYASVYNRAIPWTGPKTQLWMYFSIHGMFLFLLVSLLVWDTGRWLRSVYVRTLRGTWLILLAFLLLLILILTVAVVLATGGYPVTIVAVPLLVWTGILFLREGQSRE